MGRLFHSLRIWRQLFIQFIAISFIYRVQSLIWMIGGFLPLAIMLIWIQLAANGPISANGITYDQSDFAVYFMGMYLIRQSTVTWAILLLDRGIRRGELAPLLLRPMPPVWSHMAEHISEVMVRMPIFLVVFLLGLFLTNSLDRLDIAHLAPFILAGMGAWLITFHIHYCVGLLAFWMEGVLSLESLAWYLGSILGGGTIPIDLFPAPVRDILTWLPFASAFDFPVQILLGKIGVDLILLGFAKQIAWVVLLTLLRRQMWHAGLKRFSAMGI